MGQTDAMHDDDQLAVDILTPMEHGQWVSSSKVDVLEHEGFWPWLIHCWRTWLCIRRGWLQYEDASPSDVRPWLERTGWLRLTDSGRVRLLEARVFGGRR